MESTWETDVANAKLVFSWEARFQIFAQKQLLGSFKYFRQFQTEIVKINWLQAEHDSIQTLTTYTEDVW